jgi:plasmid stabilization system protein ParE
MRLIVDETAVGDIDGLLAWIAKDSPLAALQMARKILHTIERLSLFPEMGHRGQDHGTYERRVSATPYLVIYEVRKRPSAVIVIAVLHGARDR